MGRPQKDGFDGMMKVYQLLRSGGRKVSLAGYYAPFDLLVDGHRVEVKTCKGVSNSNGELYWGFNIHRHGRLKEETEVYVLRLENVPHSKYAMHLALLAPLGRKTISLTAKILMNGKYAEATKNFIMLRKGELFQVRENAA